MNKKDITKIPIGELLIVSVRIKDESYKYGTYKNNLIIKISRIIHTQTVRYIPGCNKVNYYELVAKIHAKEFDQIDNDPFEFLTKDKEDPDTFLESFHHKHILKYKLWTPEDAPLTINWAWMNDTYKKIAFSK